MDNIPVVVIHRGNQGYVNDCVRFAEKNGNRVYLIGDHTNRHLGIWCDHKSLDSKLHQDFCKIYKHYSDNPYKFELICFQRFFWLHELMKKEGLSEIIHMDSDILLYNKVDPDQFNSYDCVCSYNKIGIRYSASAHFSYWRLNALEDFLSFLLYVYEKEVSLLESEYLYMKKNHQYGGICDMRLLAYWIEKDRFNITNLKTVNRSSKTIYGTNIYSPELTDNYLCQKYGKEKLVNIYYDKKPYLRSISGDEKLYLGALHFQGKYKKFMHAYSRNKQSSLNYFLCDVRHYSNRIYEKILRTLGRERRFNWEE